MSASDAFVKSNVPRDQYEANGGQTVFDYNFIIFNEEDLVVLKTTDPDTDNETTTQLAAGSDYSISNVGNEDGGTITLSSGANQGERYTIYRDTDIERLTDFLQSGAYESENVNLEYDEIYAILQELSRALSRAMTLPSEAPIDNINLPSPKSDGGLLAWPNTATGGGGDVTIIDPADEGDLNKINNFNIEVTEVTSDRDMNGNKIENLGDPVDPKDAATKDYVDSISTSGQLSQITIPVTKIPANDQVIKLVHTEQTGFTHAIYRLGVIEADPNDPKAPAGVKSYVANFDTSTDIITTEKTEETTPTAIPENTNLAFGIRNTTSSPVSCSSYYTYE